MSLPFQPRHTREEPAPAKAWGGYPYFQSRFEVSKAIGFPIKLGMTGVVTPLEQS